MTFRKSLPIFSQGFTLIELLVVISIIGMLSSVTLASVQAGRDRAQIGAGLTFAGHNYQLLSVDAPVVYNFNEAVGTATIKDLSGNNYNATIDTMVNCPVDSCRSTNTPNNSGLSFHVPSGTGVQAKYVGQVKLTGITGYTVGAWVYPMTPCCSFSTSYIFEIGANNISTTDISLRFQSGKILAKAAIGQLLTDTGVSFNLNNWQYVAFSYDGSKIITYLNGRKVSTMNYVHAVSTLYDDIYIGQGNPNSDDGIFTDFGGYIDDFVLYREALTVVQIEKIYAAGLPEHKVAME